mmetsp:Transcript_94664/g.148071  ORF Transcript_94664/g.148071 Transcript_94664/m.148071 type:complete len:878 (-) Transcript_94664:116-2749(-)
MIARCRSVVVFTSLLTICETARLLNVKPTQEAPKRSTSNWEKLGRRIGGCKFAGDCGDCLTRTPSFSGDTYCKWCPFDNWEGKPFDTKPKGVCRHASANEEDCTQWSKYGVTEFSQTEPSRASDIVDALLFCPKESEEVGVTVQKVKRLAANSLYSMQFDDSQSLDVALEALNTEVRRLNRFHATNPVLFGAKFGDKELLVEAGKWSWKATLLGINFIPVVGNSISLGLNLITDAAEMATAGKQGRSQDKLISLGEEAHSQYFGDVTFGLIWKAYQEILSLSSEEVREKIESVRKSVIAEHTDVADAYQEFDSHTAVKVGKAAGHVGLFVGGFFTFGATWIAGAVWTGVDLAASAATKAAVAKGLELKTKMLLALARLKDESVWEGANDECDITDRYSGKNPCSSAPRPGDGKLVQRVCTRISPWGHSKGKIPNGLFSPQGRCLPAESMGMFLSDGLPCLTHGSCQSGYCHFDKRMQYFFSPHPRHFWQRGGEQIPVPDQLHSMQVHEVLSPSEHEERSNFSSVRPLKDFVAQYNSYEGVKFATTGTCATACPESAIGKGDCAGLTLRDTAKNVNKKSTLAAKYDFGIKIPNRIMTGFSLQGFALVGHGACSRDGRALEATTTWTLSTETETETTSDPLDECARKIWAIGGPAFMITKASETEWLCSSLNEIPGFTVLLGESQDSKCFSRVPSWPLDVYQPWNADWLLYLEDLNRVLGLLDKAEGWEEVLEKVREAYPEFCNEVEVCPDPRDWDIAVAKSVLTVLAPLSVTQMRQLCMQADPHCPSSDSSSKVKLRDLFEDEEWGEAWKRFLGKLNVEEVAKEDPEQPATLKAEFVLKLKIIATSYNFKMQDGVWDLAAAQQEFLDNLDTRRKAMED